MQSSFFDQEDRLMQLEKPGDPLPRLDSTGRQDTVAVPRSPDALDDLTPSDYPAINEQPENSKLPWA